MTQSTSLPSDLLPADALSPRQAAPRALAAALGIGVLGDFLLFAQPVGLNLFVLVAALLAAGTWLARRTGRPLTIGAVLLGALALAFAGAVAWRDAEALVALDVLALLAVLCALVPSVLHGDALDVDRAGPLAYVAGAISTGARVAFGAPVLAARAIGAAPIPSAGAVAGLGTLGRGALLAAPVLLVFGLLLANADPTFGRMLEWLFGWNGGLVAEHAVAIIILSWVAGGLLYASLLDPRRPRDPSRPDALTAVGLQVRERLHGIGLGVREVTVALGLVDLLFITFGALQLRWLFGGAASLQAAGLTVAEYARRGFFELVAVAALALPLLLVAHGIAGEEDAEREEPATAHRAFRLVSAVLIALLLVLLASAADRMRLYTDAFGLTQQRFYASALMVWLGAVFLWAAATLLRGRAAPFALGTLVSAWVFVLALHVVNPDARIANVNLARAAAGRPLDAQYLRGLSADAAPALARRAPALLERHPDAAVRCQLRWAMHTAAVRASAPADWRGWRLSRANARRVLPQSWASEVPARCG